MRVRSTTSIRQAYLHHTNTPAIKRIADRARDTGIEEVDRTSFDDRLGLAFCMLDEEYRPEESGRLDVIA